MKTVIAETLDTLDDYQLTEADAPMPGPGQIQVRVTTCSIGYVDALVALGKYQVKPQLPHTPGQEICGTVEQIGDGISDFKIGDRVFGMAPRGFSEYVVLPADVAFPAPDTLSDAEAASLPLNYLTAYMGLIHRGALSSGETVLVFGAAGGLGSAAVQIAKAKGAFVVAAASSEAKRKAALENGADAVIDLEPEDWRKRLAEVCPNKKPDIVFDPVCGPLFELAFRSLAWNGRHLVLGFVGGPIPKLPVNLSLMKGASLVGVDVRQYIEYERHRLAADFEQLLSWANGGLIKPKLSESFAFADFLEALKFAFSGQAVGKTILNIAD